ncbi:hypothetical protein LCGC14_1636730 [marine sediment metagenome]|uniref:Uncharacterized protein n=1 Tax=marine sediment metagenome TaxID=412755 RepID=A0A0F9L0I4_9ZZZZ
MIPVASNEPAGTIGMMSDLEQPASSDPTGLLGADDLHTQAKSGDMFQDTQAVSKNSG